MCLSSKLPKKQVAHLLVAVFVSTFAFIFWGATFPGFPSQFLQRFQSTGRVLTPFSPPPGTFKMEANAWGWHWMQNQNDEDGTISWFCWLISIMHIYIYINCMYEYMCDHIVSKYKFYTHTANRLGKFHGNFTKCHRFHPFHL